MNKSNGVRRRDCFETQTPISHYWVNSHGHRDWIPACVPRLSDVRDGVRKHKKHRVHEVKECLPTVGFRGRKQIVEFLLKTDRHFTCLYRLGSSEAAATEIMRWKPIEWCTSTPHLIVLLFLRVLVAAGSRRRAQGLGVPVLRRTRMLVTHARTRAHTQKERERQRERERGRQAGRQTRRRAETIAGRSVYSILWLSSLTHFFDTAGDIALKTNSFPMVAI